MERMFKLNVSTSMDWNSQKCFIGMHSKHTFLITLIRPITCVCTCVNSDQVIS